MSIFSSNTYTFLFHLEHQYRMNIYHIIKSKYKKKEILPKKQNSYPKLSDDDIYNSEYDFGLDF